MDIVQWLLGIQAACAADPQYAMQFALGSMRHIALGVAGFFVLAAVWSAR